LNIDAATKNLMKEL